MDASERTVRLVVAGQVQGVGFRAFVVDEARRRGVRGWVRNRRNGAVEALVSGPRDAVEEMIGACRRGPRWSRVDGVDIEDVKEDALETGASSAAFAIRPTL